MNELPKTLIDRFQRRVDYVRLSVTDRCDFRCVYCMAEDMTFIPQKHILTLEEIHEVARAFVELGVRKIRLTGGEPLIRNNILALIEPLGEIPGLDQLVITTNGSQLHRLAGTLRQFGVKRINISLDSLNPRKFRQLTRHGNLDQVLAGIDTAIAADFEQIRINTVILKGRNEDEVLELVDFAQQRGVDIAFIEEMPMGLIDEHDRALSFCSSEELRDRISQKYTLNNFCHLCNRVRVTAEGRLLLCLGNEHSVDLRAVLRDPNYTLFMLKHRIVDAMSMKPERHHFDLNQAPDIVRFMNTTGG